MRIKEKQQFVKNLEEEIQESSSIILTNYQGIDANTVNVLRKELKKADCTLKVIKNRLARRSFENVDEKKYGDLLPHMKGPVAVILASQDPSAGLKVFKNYSEENEIMSFKTGIIGDDVFDSEKLKKLAELPDREVLIGQVVNVFNAPVQNLHSVLSGIIKKVIYALKDLQEKKPAEASAEEKQDKEKEAGQENVEEEGVRQETQKQSSGEKDEISEGGEEKNIQEEQSAPTEEEKDTGKPESEKEEE